jgi:hypothetical protein
MSFRSAYRDVKNYRATPKKQALFRDKTPEQEKHMMDQYYIRMRNWTPSNGRK